jgi:DNA (cytosine-5)-methyltransferase 1
MNFYNEHDPKAAAWLRELIASGHLPPGDVDERSITDIKSHEIANYTQCHFFAGIGGWSLALELAGWPASRPVWTGSCPCQPFSGAGEGKGASDDRHLWPVFRRLISELHPERVFGEQVAQAIGFNWLDGVSADMEADGYAVGATVLGAHSVGAPHIRQRLFWVANSISTRIGGGNQRGSGEDRQQMEEQENRENPTNQPGNRSENALRRMADSECGRCESGAVIGSGAATIITPEDCQNDRVEIARDNGTRSNTGKAGDIGGESMDARPAGLRQTHGPTGASGADSRSASSHWDDAVVIQGLDGKARRIEPGTFPLADGIPGRVGLLRGYGNAIVPQVAAEFVKAFSSISPANAKAD